MFPSDECAVPHHSRKGHEGFSIIEILIVIAIIGILLSTASPVYQNYVDRRNVAQAKQGILDIQTAIDRFYIENNRFPNYLVEINMDDRKDPWGSPFYYLNVANYDKYASDGKMRRDKKLKPVNSDYDLYSAGKDMLSKPAFTATVSRDDIVRCNNGKYIGFAGDY